MKKRIPVWLIGLLITLAVVAVPVAIFWPKPAPVLMTASGVLPTPSTSPRRHRQGPLDTPQQSDPGLPDVPSRRRSATDGLPRIGRRVGAFDVSWRDEPVTIGKANQINNFCIGARESEAVHVLPPATAGRKTHPTTSRSGERRLPDLPR
jgi:hypothetical protein